MRSGVRHEGVVDAAIGYVPAEDADEQHSRYFWALRFFTAFARVHNVGVQFISETISTESFHFVHSKLEAYTDLIITDKTQIALWSNRSHLALRSYLELLMMLAAMGTNPDEKVQRAAKQIEINLFYVAEYREIFFKLLKEFKESKFSRAYLKDLVITIHIFLKLLEVYLKKQHHLFVKKKQRAKKGAGKKAVKAKPQKISKITDEARKEIWNSQLEALRTVLQGVMDDPDGIEECVPFDTVSDVAVEQQTDVGRRRIQMALLEKESTRAVALLVASKKCWPIQVDLFGSVGDSVDSDLKRLNKMLLDVLPDLIEELPEPEVLEVIEEGYDAGLDGSRQDIAEDETEADGSDGHKQEASVKDVEFHLESFLKRFATPSHVEPYFLLLKDYPNNTFPVNHAILKMMHRIAVDLLLPGMLFQVSLFRLYHRLLKQEHPTGDPRFHAELRQFMQFILGKFFEKMREDPKAGILSILFWKSRYEAHELVEGPTEKPQQLKLKKSVADDSGKAVLERFAVDREGGEDVVVEGVARWNRAESPEDDDGVDVFSRLRDMDADRSGSPDGGALISRKKPAAKRRRGKAREPSEELVATSSSHDDDGGPRVDDAVEQDEDALGRLNELEVEARKRAEVKRQRMENARLKASGKRRVLRPDSDNDDEADAQAVISPDGSSSSKENVEDDGLEYEFAATQPPTEEEEDAEDAPIRTALKGAKKRVFDEDDEDSNNSNSGPAATSSEPSPQPVPKKARSAYVAYDDSDEDEESSRRPKLVMSVDDE
ncbi:Protein timeless-like protein [Hypsibius exemplaris]|uniref:Protein timeless-like protein n=1 Tax=Hypsibius exemplaris TaxID=2072580 RepID=A0A1W0WHG6_HYPEX|nr:Protein timeless-like protein [Hypsibius exemplaris]